MKICVLNGSPKGNEYSITLRYVQYIERKFPEHEYTYFEISKKISVIEKTKDKTSNKSSNNAEGLFADIIQTIKESDAIIWAFPVYFLSIPGQLKRFFELICENEADHAFEKKYCTSISTSAHFYDHLAHQYVRAVCEDFKMNYFDGYSAMDYDLLTEEHRRNFTLFAQSFFSAVSTKAPVSFMFEPITESNFIYVPENISKNSDEKSKSSSKSIILLTDQKKNSNLERMVTVFASQSKYEIIIRNINDIALRSGCIGCIKCTSEGICVFKDEIRDIFMEELANSDAIIFAANISQRNLSANWKMFLDRSFFLGHRPILAGKQAAVIISGPLRQSQSLQQILEGFFLTAKMNILGIVSDEYSKSETITSLLSKLSADIAYGIENNYKKPITFPGYAGHLLFRDFTYRNSYIFQENHKYYFENGMYDYPQYDKNIRKTRRVFNKLFQNPAFKKKAKKSLKQNMIKPFTQLFKNKNI